MYLDSKDDRLCQERHLEEERREKRLEERHQQQMKAIQDKFAYKQDQLGKQKAKEEKASRNAEIWRMEDKRRREKEQASKDIHTIPKMTASENIYNCIVRIERILIAKDIPKDMWAGALGQVFTGNALEQYSLHVDTFSGNYEGLKDVLLQTCGFSTHDNLNFYKMIYSPSSSASSSSWAKEASYRMFSLLKTCPNVNAKIADSILAMVTDALASFFVIAPLSMDGRSSIFITKPANTQERLQAFQTFANSPAYKKESIKPTFKKSFGYRQDRKPYHSEYNEHKPYHSDSHERTSNHSVYNQTKFSNSDNHSTSKPDKPVFVPICHKCGIKGHKSPECPQVNSQSQNIAKKNSNNSSQKKDPTVKLVLSDQENFSVDFTTSGFDNRVEGNPMKINMLLPAKVTGHDATFEIDSGAHISLVSKDLVSESDMVPGKITIKSVLGQSQTLPCAGLNVAINGVSKYYKLGVSDRIGSKMIILGCDIGVKDHRHFYDMACDFKQEQVQVKLTRALSKKLQADATDRQQQQLQD